MKKPKIAVIGVGMVGGAMLKYYQEAIPYSPHQYPENKEKINEADIIFICVPTPFIKEGKGFDLSALEDAFTLIKREKIVVIRSTVLPGTTDYFQRKYPEHQVLFNPEFLTEATADQDFSYPDRQIVGYTKKSYQVAKDVIQVLPLAPFERIIPAKEAEMVKYFGNTWFSTKVVFANQMYDLCARLGVDYETIKECAAADKRIGRSHLEIFHKGYRGYGGKCLPKDIRALIQFADKNNIDLKLLKIVEEINNILTEGRDR